MKKIVYLLLSSMLLGLLAGCVREDPPAGTKESTQAPTKETTPPISTAAPETTEPKRDAIGAEDTYWLAYEYFDEERKEKRTTESAGWFLDLVIFADGTARYRDIHNGLCIMDDDGLRMQWERDEDGQLRMYNAAYDAPLLEGSLEDGVLSLSNRGLQLFFREEPMPQTVGQMYSPAELTGTWVAVSAETEGCAWDLMPSSFETMIFRTATVGEELTLVADQEYWDHYGRMNDAGYELSLEVLDEPLYEGCENEAWSVRIGSESPKDANGYPVGSEMYVTLLGRDTLLLQNYYTLDGAPALSYLIYRRMPPSLTWWDVEPQELAYTNWYCASCLDAEENMVDIPAEFRDLWLQLDGNGTCYIGDDTLNWQVSRGGTVMIHPSEESDTELWLGGAIRASYAGGGDPFYEMYLYHEGSLLRFLIDSRG